MIGRRLSDHTLCAYRPVCHHTRARKRRCVQPTTPIQREGEVLDSTTYMDCVSGLKHPTRTRVYISHSDNCCEPLFTPT